MRLLKVIDKMAAAWTVWCWLLLGLSLGWYRLSMPAPAPLPAIQFASPTLSFSSKELRVAAQTEIVVAPPAAEDISVRLSATPAAMVGDLPTHPISIPAGDAKVPLKFEVLLAKGPGVTEELALQLTDPSNAVLGPCVKQTVRIAHERDIVPVANLRVSSERIVEGSPTPCEAYVELDQPALRDLEVGFRLEGAARDTVRNGLPTARQAFSIVRGSRQSNRVPLKVAENNVVDGELDLTIGLVASSGFSLGEQYQHRLAVIDNDEAQVTISLDKDRLTEGSADSRATITARLNAPTTRALSLPYRVSGSAKPDVDFRPLPGSLVFAPGETQATVEIVLIDDDIPESESTIEVQFTPPSHVRILPADKLVIHVADNDERWLFIAADRERVVKGPAENRVTVTASLSVPAPAALVLHYRVSGTAIPVTDYEPLSGSLVIAAERKQAQFEIVIKGNDNPEREKLLELRFDAPAAVSGVKPDTLRIAIVNNAQPRLKLTLDRKTLEEAGPGNKAALTAELSAPALAPVTLEYRIDSTLRPGEDYLAQPATLTIPAGQSRAVLELSVKDNDRFTGDQQLVIQATGARGAILGEPKSFTLQVVDDEAEGRAMVLLLATEELANFRNPLAAGLKTLVDDPKMGRQLIGRSILVVGPERDKQPTWTCWHPNRAPAPAPAELIKNDTALEDVFNIAFHAFGTLLPKTHASSRGQGVILFVLWVSRHSPRDLATRAPKAGLLKPDPTRQEMYVYWIGGRQDRDPWLENEFGKYGRDIASAVVTKDSGIPSLGDEIKQILEMRSR